jgi:putative ATPase
VAIGDDETDLFAPEPGEAVSADTHLPLAVRMRPSQLSEVVGQQHLLKPGSPLRRLIEGGGLTSVILYGPPGTGKTTLANLVSAASGRKFVPLSALSAGVKDVRDVIEQAKHRQSLTATSTVLFIDEVHRFSKTQQDALLAAVEDRVISLVAATTENPFFSVVSPLLSRSLILQLQPLTAGDIDELIGRALTDERGLAGRFTISAEGRKYLVRLASGDARRSLTVLESAADATASLDASEITLEIIETCLDSAAVHYDRDGDQHYDVISAFIKSIRGSDVDAALHYLARMLEAGEDPRFIARRLVVHASEDIGLADPTALLSATAAAQAVQLIGLPECRINLAQATIHLATAPKSNAVIMAIDAAMQDVRAGLAGPVPRHLRDGHYGGAEHLGNAQGYEYPHNVPEGVVTQQYAPDELLGKDYYNPTERAGERALHDRVARLRKIIRG